MLMFSFLLFQMLMCIPPVYQIYVKQSREHAKALGVVEMCRNPVQRKDLDQYCVDREVFVETWPVIRTFSIVSDRISILHFVLYTIMDTWMGMAVVAVGVWAFVAWLWVILSNPAKTAQNVMNSGRYVRQIMAPSNSNNLDLPIVTEILDHSNTLY